MGRGTRMEQTYEKPNSLKEGIISGFPIVIGYFPVAMAFGLLAKTVDVSLMDSFLFSSMVFAGASQFMALELIRGGISASSIILATFLLNLRHLMMSASLSVKLEAGIKRKWLPLIAFGVTDETFSVASLKSGQVTAPYLVSLQGVSYLSWVCGTAAGYLAGSIIPEAVQNSLGIGLYAMFAAILVPEVKKSLNILILSIGSGVLYALISYLKLLPGSWNLISTIMISSVAGVIFLKDDSEERKQ
jgi:4-azaleucine resistance transporter AzlC